jgi:hypothetical protein
MAISKKQIARPDEQPVGAVERPAGCDQRLGRSEKQITASVQGMAECDQALQP